MTTEHGELHIPKHPPTITFGARSDQKWFLKLCAEGIIFNKVDYPQFTEDDFAREFIRILERNFVVKFHKKFDSEAGYLKDGVMIEKLDHPNNNRGNMNREQEILARLRKNLANTIEWYHENLNNGDAVYDECHDQFNQMSRGDLMDILELLSLDQCG